MTYWQRVSFIKKHSFALMGKPLKGLLVGAR